MSEGRLRVALAGQPNSGKSTVFNLLTGARQHVANYPGVTVEKKVGHFSHDGKRIELVDLPGTYALSTFSLEERVARDFLIEERPEVVVQVADATTIKRHLALFLQIAEMERPLVLGLNKSDVARKNNISVDAAGLAEFLGVAVIPMSAKTGQGRTELKQAIVRAVDRGPAKLRIDYGPLEPVIAKVEALLMDIGGLPDHLPRRWLAVKLLEDDAVLREQFRDRGTETVPLLAQVERFREEIEKEHGKDAGELIGMCRYRLAAATGDKFLTARNPRQARLTDRIDSVLCHKVFGPLILVGVIYLLYELAIVQGYRLTTYTWPLLEGLKGMLSVILPPAAYIYDPVVRSLGLWFIDSVNALLNYIPVFLVLFSLVAFLEDVGYMPRMAFIMDRLFKRFGLHGQSTLPMVLGGVYIGGCAVPAIMSTKGIPDERARLATILIIPMLNCLAKIPLYILLVHAYFPAHKGVAMFFVATISLFMALPVAKILSLTVLRDRDTAPFLMEMPAYHLPTIRGVLGRAVERTWLFVKKIVTVVAAVAVVVFVLLQYPGLSAVQQDDYTGRGRAALARFVAAAAPTAVGERLTDEARVMELIAFSERYKDARRRVSSTEASEAVNARFAQLDPGFYEIVMRGKKSPAARQLDRAFGALERERQTIRREIRAARIDASFLGQIGRALEPVTQWAGFNWRINVSLLSALAAKESLVATLGAIYQQDDEGGASLEERMKATETGFTPLHALALILFMVLYPPCLATLMTIKLQTASYKWMLFSLGYQLGLGVVVASLVFTGARLLGLTGLQAMYGFFGLMVLVTVAVGCIDRAPSRAVAGAPADGCATRA
ncbi:MAG: ferrous iron transport protein B [Deltaproteobacteria bacterium]|nr:ferrous iron transport protein B [Candidatus Anaeroferrophillacea bacterium]